MRSCGFTSSNFLNVFIYSTSHLCFNVLEHLHRVKMKTVNITEGLFNGHFKICRKLIAGMYNLHLMHKGINCKIDIFSILFLFCRS